MPRSVSKGQNSQKVQLVKALQNLSTANSLNDYSNLIIEDILWLEEPKWDYDWFTPWLIKMINKTFAKSPIQRDITLMYLGILEGYHELKITNRYSKFLAESTFLSEKGTKSMDEDSLKKLSKNNRNNLSHRSNKCVEILAESIQNEIALNGEKTFEGLEEYMEDHTKENGEIIKIPIHCYLSSSVHNSVHNQPVNLEESFTKMYLNYLAHFRCTTQLIKSYQLIIYYILLVASSLLVIQYV